MVSSAKKLLLSKFCTMVTIQITSAFKYSLNAKNQHSDITLMCRNAFLISLSVCIQATK